MSTRLWLSWLLLACLPGCSLAHGLAAANRSTAQFRQSTEDPRIFYEPGAEAMAHAGAAAIPQAVDSVEQRQFGRFTIPVRVYFCASIKCFTSYGANAGAGGVTSNHRVFISPKPENTIARVPRLLMHELSHLHLGQKLGLWQTMALPPWFSEGLAVYTSEGGGAEGVTDAEARQAIAQGRTFVPENGSVWSRKYGRAYGLSEHLFYREAGLFIAWLAGAGGAKFRALLLSVEGGRSLDAAFHEAYGTGAGTLWLQFVAAVSSPQGGSLPSIGDDSRNESF